jgi:GGDEF domain-containing protein
MTNAFRVFDVFARMGEDEFVVFLTGVLSHEAEDLIHFFCQALEEKINYLTEAMILRLVRVLWILI